MKNLAKGPELLNNVKKALAKHPSIKSFSDDYYLIKEVIDYVDVEFFVRKEKLYHLIINMIDNKPTLITGPTGTGKTELIWYVGKLLGQHTEIIDMSSMQDPQSGLIGVRQLDNGNTLFKPAKFLEAIQKPSLVVLDEVNRAPLEANNILFPLLDMRQGIDVPFAESHLGFVKKHKDCAIVATANIGAAYTGVNKMDLAFANRFSKINVDWIEPHIEAAILQNRYKLSDKLAIGIAKLAAETRRLSASDGIQALSIRHTLDIARLIYNGFPSASAIDAVVEPLYYNEKSIGTATDSLSQIRTITQGIL